MNHRKASPTGLVFLIKDMDDVDISQNCAKHCTLQTLLTNNDCIHKRIKL